MIEIPSDLHPDLVPLAFLLGNWAGAGVSDFPGAEKCNFGQEVTCPATAPRYGWPPTARRAASSASSPPRSADDELGPIVLALVKPERSRGRGAARRVDTAAAQETVVEPVAPGPGPPYTSTITVNGPWFVSETRMSAPNRPVSTCAPSARSSATTSSTSGSATSPGAAAFHVGRRPLRASP
ncbi:hypothetical protein SCALM49S_01513 [Streptomyces californicus]